MPCIWTSAVDQNHCRDEARERSQRGQPENPPSKAVPNFLPEKLGPKEPERDRSPEKLQRAIHQAHEKRCSAKKIFSNAMKIPDLPRQKVIVKATQRSAAHED
jgi:hypothetical protein